MPALPIPELSALSVSDFNGLCSNLSPAEIALITEFTGALGIFDFSVADESWTGGSVGQGGLGLRFESVDGRHTFRCGIARLRPTAEIAANSVYFVDGTYQNTSGLGSTKIPARAFPALIDAIRYLNGALGNAYGEGLARIQHAESRGLFDKTATQLTVGAAASLATFELAGGGTNGIFACFFVFGAAFYGCKLFAVLIRARQG